MVVTPNLPINYNGPRRKIKCTNCKQNFFVTDIFYQRHKPIYCSSCSITLTYKNVEQYVNDELVKQATEKDANKVYSDATVAENEIIATAKHTYTQLYPLKATSNANAHDVAIELTKRYINLLDAYVVNTFVYVFSIVDIQFFIIELTNRGLLEKLHIQPMPIAIKYFPVTYEPRSVISKKKDINKIQPLSLSGLKCASCSSQGLYICNKCREVFCLDDIFMWNDEYYCVVHLPLYNKI